MIPFIFMSLYVILYHFVTLCRLRSHIPYYNKGYPLEIWKCPSVHPYIWVGLSKYKGSHLPLRRFWHPLGLINSPLWPSKQPLSHSHALLGNRSLPSTLQGPLWGGQTFGRTDEQINRWEFTTAFSRTPSGMLPKTQIQRFCHSLALFSEKLVIGPTQIR